MQEEKRETTTTRFCAGHRKKHEFEAWRWSNKRVGKRTVWWCAECIDCDGCKEIHPQNGYSLTTDNPDGPGLIHLCAKWASPGAPSIQKRMQNMSPEEVMSGVQYGYPRDPSLGADSEDFTPKHTKQVKELGKAMDAI